MEILNQKVLDLISEYPTDGTHGYHWVNGFDGATRNIHYQGRLILKSEDQKRTYCCGLTLETYLRACDGRDLGGFQDVLSIKREWFCASGRYKNVWENKGPVDALCGRGLGSEVIGLELAQAGDFCQIWRANGSGHSVVFIDRVEGGIRYWSTQPITNGIGYRSEFFEGKNPITHIYVCRAYLPPVLEDQAQNMPIHP